MRASIAACGLALLASCVLASPASAEPASIEETADDAAPAARPSGLRVPRAEVDEVRLEAAALPDAPEASVQSYVGAAAHVLWQPSRSWEWRIGARLDGTAQNGGSADDERWRADLTDTYLRWRRGETRLTLGMQTVIWGRVDEVPLIDRVSRADLTRFVLDDLPDRRRSAAALRWEQGLDDGYAVDAIVLPAFRGALLPSLDSTWSVVDRRRGRVLGIDGDPAFAAFVRAARVDEAGDGGSGGAALRLTRTGVSPVDWGLTLARTRSSLPYYEADPARMRLVEIHPYQNFAGVDGEWVAADVTWRAEIGRTGSVPLTSRDGSLVYGHAWDAVAAAEFFPGGRDLRVSLQLVARDVDAPVAVRDRTRYLGVNGEIEARLAEDRWRLGLRFASGLDAHDTYLGPKISYLGWEPHEVYLAAHFFDGDERSLGGFHRDHDMVAVGLRARF